MCGLAGLYDGKGRYDLHRILSTFQNALQHRGPDQHGQLIDGRFGLCHTRLSILDLSEKSKQPFVTPDGRYVMVYNGELYNYRSLRRLLQKEVQFVSDGDTEVLLQAYLKWGADCLQRLDGMFAFVIYDRVEARFFGARDRLGIKPLFMADLPDLFAFSSECLPLLKSGLFTPQLNHQALFNYLTMEYVAGPYSIDANVQKLEPGHYFVYENGTLNIKSYWDMDSIEERENVEWDEAVFKIDALLKKSVKNRLISDRPLGVFLSGGIDSSLLAALAVRQQPKLKTFSIRFEAASFDESRHADHIARYLGTEHVVAPYALGHVLQDLDPILSQLSEPLADASLFPTYYLSQLTKEHVTVSLSGDGGDELFAGYPTYQALKALRLLPAIPRSWIRYLLAHMKTKDSNLTLKYKLIQFLKGYGQAPALQQAYWMGAFAEQGKRALLWDNGDFSGYQQRFVEKIQFLYDAYQGQDGLNRVLRYDISTYLRDDLLVKTDQASMHHGLEVRVPFLSHQLVEYVLSLPSRMKLKGFVTKAVLKKIAKNYMPVEIATRPKKGFGMPVSAWLKGPLKVRVEDVLFQEKCLPLFNMKAIRGMWQQHQQGQRDFRKEIWTLFMFEAWRQKHRLYGE